MEFIFATLSQGEGLRLGVVMGAFLYGMRHGIDLDHLAAISDITSSQTSRSRALSLATVYALGHAVVVLVLGMIAILVGQRLPSGVDEVMEHVVGISLLILGAYVIYSLIRYGRDFRMRSRWQLLFAGVRRTFRWLTRQPAPEKVEIEHSHGYDHPGHDHGTSIPISEQAGAPVAIAAGTKHRHVVSVPDDPFVSYGVPTAAGIGMIHGIGAETPTQVLLLVTAAGVSGEVLGVVLLLTFIAGLLISNTAVAIATAFGFAEGRRVPTIYLTLALITGIASLVMGGLYIAGKMHLLPSLFG